VAESDRITDPNAEGAVVIQTVVTPAQEPPPDPNQ
jgi:hypothetical protein